MTVDFILHFLSKVCSMKEIHARVVRLCVNYLKYTVEEKKVELQQY